MTKAELRRQLRDRYQRSDKAVDGSIGRNLLVHPVYHGAERVFFYVGIGTEIDTMPIIEAALRAGKTVALPKSFGQGVMKFYSYTGQLAAGMYGIPEPVGGEELVPRETDLMIVPGLAFDSLGYRLGQGAGYYDRYLAAHPCHTIGLCRSEFLLKEIPVLWNDLPVEYVITEKRSLG